MLNNLASMRDGLLRQADTYQGNVGQPRFGQQVFHWQGRFTWKNDLWTFYGRHSGIFSVQAPSHESDQSVLIYTKMGVGKD